MSSKLACLNGHLVPQEQATLSLADRGFVWGATATDRSRTHRRQLFRWEQHLARFRRSCELCRVPQPIGDSTLTATAQHLLEHNSAGARADDEFTVVLFATPGETGPNLGMTVERFDGKPYVPLLQRGARIVTPAVRHVPDECIPRQAKMRSRMHWWIAEQQAREIDPEAAALLLDGDNCITETAMANIAIVREKTILTPPRKTVLDGISMRVVEEIANEVGIVFREAALTLDDCYAANEILLTSTPYCVVGVSSLNNKRIPWPGPVLARLWGNWTQLVGIDIWQQILPAAQAC